jgi:hypothetical protein
MRMFVPLCAVLIGGGVVIALYFSGSFSLGGWIGGVALFSPGSGAVRSRLNSVVTKDRSVLLRLAVLFQSM